MRVLIINSEKKKRDEIAGFLKDDDWQISKVSDNHKGLVLTEEKNIEIIIADYDHDPSSRKKFIQGLESLDMASLPFLIFLTDEATQQDALNTLGSVPGDYVIKPVTSNNLYGRMVVAKRSLLMKKRLDRVKRDSKTLALYDQLTGAFNRQAIYDHALAEISRSQREDLSLSIAMIEISNLQEIESKYGNKIRDQVLRYVSSAIRANVRIYDLLGRWIGAKFMLMLPTTSLLDASKVIDRVSQSISTIEISPKDNGRLEIVVKHGVSSLPKNETIPLYMLVEQANSALMEATNLHEKQVVYFEE